VNRRSAPRTPQLPRQKAYLGVGLLQIAVSKVIKKTLLVTFDTIFNVQGDIFIKRHKL